MKTRPLLLIAAMALVASAGPVFAGDQGSASVAEMMQKRHENQVREQLVSAGRYDDVRKFDEERLKRQHEQQGKVVAQMNEELARVSKTELSPNSFECDLVRNKVR